MNIYVFWAIFATGALIFAYWVTHKPSENKPHNEK